MQRFARHSKNYQKAQKAKRKMKTIAGRLVRELKRKLPADRLAQYQGQLDLYQRVLDQKKT